MYDSDDLESAIYNIHKLMTGITLYLKNYSAEKENATMGGNLFHSISIAIL